MPNWISMHDANQWAAEVRVDKVVWRYRMYYDYLLVTCHYKRDVSRKKDFIGPWTKEGDGLFRAMISLRIEYLMQKDFFILFLTFGDCSCVSVWIRDLFRQQNLCHHHHLISSPQFKNVASVFWKSVPRRIIRKRVIYTCSF